MDRKYIKQQAKNVLKSSGLNFYILTGIILILSIASAIPIIGVFAVLLSFFCIFIFTKSALRATRGELVTTENMMEFKELKLYIKVQLYILLKSLLYMIPTFIGFMAIYSIQQYNNDMFNLFLALVGSLLVLIGYIYCFYKVLGFSFSIYILFDYPKAKCKDIIKASEVLMKGYRWNYIVFALSFIPWLLLASITCGLAYIYIIPYMQLSTTVYYLERLKQDK